MERFQGMVTKYTSIETAKQIAFDERVKQTLVPACRKSNYITVEMLRNA